MNKGKRQATRGHFPVFRRHSLVWKLCGGFLLCIAVLLVSLVSLLTLAKKEKA